MELSTWHLEEKIMVYRLSKKNLVKQRLNQCPISWSYGKHMKNSWVEAEFLITTSK